MKELSLRPYNGRLFFCKSRKDYEKSHRKVFAAEDVLQCNQKGRFGGGEGKDGMWSYLVYAKEPSVLAHEMAHVVFHVFLRCGINPADSGGEQFCYLLSQLIMDAE